MRKTIHVALALLCTVLLVGCKTAEQKEAERQQMLAEMNEAAQARNELRKAYCNSMLCTTGRAYLEAALEELVPGCEYTVDMEPDGMLLKEEPSEQFSIVVTDAETARLCFTNFYATIKVDYWNHGVEAEKLCAALLERGDRRPDCRWRKQPRQRMAARREERNFRVLSAAGGMRCPADFATDGKGILDSAVNGCAKQMMVDTEDTDSGSDG